MNYLDFKAADKNRNIYLLCSFRLFPIYFGMFLWLCFRQYTTITRLTRVYCPLPGDATARQQHIIIILLLLILLLFRIYFVVECYLYNITCSLGADAYKYIISIILYEHYNVLSYCTGGTWIRRGVVRQRFRCTPRQRVHTYIYIIRKHRIDVTPPTVRTSLENSVGIERKKERKKPKKTSVQNTQDPFDRERAYNS